MAFLFLSRQASFFRQGGGEGGDMLFISVPCGLSATCSSLELGRKREDLFLSSKRASCGPGEAKDDRDEQLR